MIKPEAGLITFLAEGKDTKGSIGYSREIHFPGNYNQCNKNASGVTIGRGYDVGRRFKSEILSDLRASGVPQNQAKEISKSSMLQGCQAANFVKENKSKIGEITEMQQIKLFNITYDKYVKRAIVFYKKYKGIKSLEWNRKDSKIRDVFVDLLYQGLMTKDMVRYFEENKKEDVINMIRRKKGIMMYEKNRGRIQYLTNGN
ncbi:toxin homologue of phage lysozyme [Rosenbergiella nectarea]|uniref:Toxin homologue of phage lysozyme n=1 Tax=Rosenbergiella nectarea TaxID=988801 RepID=A0A1H9GZJ1_9GAMM|nr:pesticin C-terminus-like muramidase [Rosenbergiella nectarea]SEQ55490.1 toxin homologue of phage lysozyme [Rosenbergiella nectarea]